jgi:type IV secretion system protein VirD4
MGKGILGIQRAGMFLSMVIYRIRAFLTSDNRLHKARFAHPFELRHLLTSTPPSCGLLLGNRKGRDFVTVRPTTTRREIGNLLIVAPTRAGKGLLATSQLLSWQHSVIVNDIKGDLYAATAGYRATLGKVFVIDPTGIGNCYDPLQGKHTEDALYSAATHLLYQADEGEGRIFTQRAILMLTQLFLAARYEGLPPLPYVRYITLLGLVACATRLNSLSPDLAARFLDERFEHANLTGNKFLISAWETLCARMRPLLTETVVRCFLRSDFTAEEVIRSSKPVTVYIRWPEKDLLTLSPLVRLVWGTLIYDLITVYDSVVGKGCQPVLLLVDEAGRTAIPMLADQATTVVGRGISLWIAIQSLSQLEAEYGRARSLVLRDNMDSQIYYRPTDLATAKYLEDRLGSRSAFAHSTTLRDGEEVQEGQTERPIPLLASQEIAQLSDEEIIGFHRHLPPFQLIRMDWRRHPTFTKRQSIPAPELSPLPQIADIPTSIIQNQNTSSSYRIVDPDEILKS